MKDMKDVLGRAIVLTTRNNFECYQLEATRDFGMTKTQLATACGISTQGIDNVIRNTNPKKYAPHMTSFIGQRVTLTRVVLPSGGKAKIVLKWDFCKALMAYYLNKKSTKVERIINEKLKLSPGEFKVENAERVVENGLEYFVLENGDRGMSLRGLCCACKTSHGAVNQLIGKLSSPAYSDWASSFTHENIFLTHEVTKNGKRVVLLQMEFCEAVMAYFARSKKTKHYKQVVASTVLNFDLKL
jgi:hypothetical protein